MQNLNNSVKQESSNTLTVSIIDARGQVMYNTNTIGTSNISLPTTNWSAGLYLVKVSDKKSQWSGKLFLTK